MLQSQVTPFIPSNPEDSPRDSKRCERMLALPARQHERSVDYRWAAPYASTMLKRVRLSRYPACVLR